MKKDVFIPIRVDEDDFVELTFEEFEEFINKAYESGFKDGVESINVTVPNIQKNWWDGNKGWWENPPMWYTTSTTPDYNGPCTVNTTNNSKEYTYTSSASTVNPTTTSKVGLITPTENLSFNDCINFLKNRK